MTDQPMTYDGFISYSHAADDLLAPRLQAGLQRFAKPWWKRRALRVFRDESSLSANPHLWASITEALDMSGWFVLLLSPDAAQSEWVSEEIRYWVANRDRVRILPVLTDGGFGWVEGDVAGSAVPEALRGVFEAEPRWVDLRFAKGEEQLDLQDPRFADVVADVAAAIRGIPKDELAGEEVRQHRRTVRTAWAAGVLLLGLAAVAVWAGFLSARNAEAAQANAEEAALQASIADEQRQEAEAQRAEAEAQREEAESQRQVAEEQRAEAEIARAAAESGELAASAISVLERDPELALLLTLEAARIGPDEEGLIPEARISLRRALSAHLVEERVEVSADYPVLIDFQSIHDGFHFATGGGTVGYWRWGLRGPEWEVEVALPGSELLSMGVLGDATVASFLEPDAEHVKTVVVDWLGDVTAVLPSSSCLTRGVQMTWGPSQSPDAEYLVLWDGTENCEDGGDQDWVSLINRNTWEEEFRFDTGSFETISFTADGSVVAIHADPFTPVEIRSFPDLELLSTLETGSVRGVISPDGSLFVTRGQNEGGFRPRLWDIETGELIDVLGPFDSFVTNLEFSEDGQRVMAIGSDSTAIWSAESTELLITIPTRLASGNLAWEYANTVGRGLELGTTSEGSGEVIAWNLEGAESRGRLDVLPFEGVVWVNPNELSGGSLIGLQVYEFGGEGPPGIEVQAIDPLTGRKEGSAPLGSNTYTRLPDGRFLLLLEDSEVVGPPRVWDPVTDAIETLPACSAPLEEWVEAFEAEDFFFCEDGRPVLGEWAVASTDGSMIAIGALAPVGTRQLVEFWDVGAMEYQSTLELETLDSVEWLQGAQLFGPGWLLLLEGSGADPTAGSVHTVYDTATGERLAVLDASDWWRGPVELSPDGSSVYLLSNSGDVWEYDTSTWQPVRTWTAQDGRGRGMALSPDGRQLATTGEDGFVMVWDLESLTLVDQIPVFFPSDAIWIDEKTMGVVSRDGQWHVFTLSDDVLLQQARITITRSFTEQECRLYGIHPCPTLEESKES